MSYAIAALLFSVNRSSLNLFFRVKHILSYLTSFFLVPASIDLQEMMQQSKPWVGWTSDTKLSAERLVSSPSEIYYPKQLAHCYVAHMQLNRL